MSAFGPKRTSLAAPHMSAFGGKADISIGTCPLSRPLLGVKRTCRFALHRSASDPKRTFRRPPTDVQISRARTDQDCVARNIFANSSRSVAETSDTAQ